MSVTLQLKVEYSKNPLLGKEGKGRSYYISLKPLQPPLAKGRRLNTHD